MTDEVKLLDAAKEITGSDTETGRRIGMKQGHISDVRNGRRGLSAYQAAKIAEIIGKRWYDVALPILARQAKTHQEQKYWLGKLELLRKIAVPATLAVSLAVIHQLGEGTEAQANVSGAATPLYIMLTSWLLFIQVIFWPARSSFAQKTEGIGYAERASTGSEFTSSIRWTQ